MDDTLDCLIIGGGPAGLTAAIYLSRFHLDIMVGPSSEWPGFTSSLIFVFVRVPSLRRFQEA